MVEDLTDSLASYEEKINKKIDEENKLRMRPFVHKHIENAKLKINQLKV